ncbi:unnamed protein product [Periconia digitata]|uniref:F-box domain-containing protein n=1 Tax=Periconia digitata TaxID=1303443 RepID=A0A9W4USR8_9PLEO|nr:unnamed protein product [Periconia digitata]
MVKKACLCLNQCIHASMSFFILPHYKTLATYGDGPITQQHKHVSKRRTILLASLKHCSCLSTLLPLPCAMHLPAQVLGIQLSPKKPKLRRAKSANRLHACIITTQPIHPSATSTRAACSLDPSAMRNEPDGDKCKAGHGDDDIWGVINPRDTRIQIYLSLALGLTAFLTFCWLRPRWQGLYAARKKQNNRATALPDLPNTFFGWILPLWRITDDQVLASAGLDAYVYLTFFKMALKFLVVALFFALAVIKPVHDTHPEKKIPADGDKAERAPYATWTAMATDYEYYTDYLWMYLVFAYLFTALILYLIVAETRKIIEVRQKYLGSQTTITDRTIRLSGIPLELRSEDKIRAFIEGLEIGKVESVTLCKNWGELDKRISQRHVVLRKLEEAWTVHLGSRRIGRSLETLPVVQPTPPASDVEMGESSEAETARLLSDGDGDPDDALRDTRPRPMAKIWYGRFKLRFKNVDAIDYYEEKLHRLDAEIKTLRKKDFEPTPLAFVTMDSVATAQMAIQAVLDPSPLQLLANSSPAPSDVVWVNTYLPRGKRMMRAWSITFFIGILSVFWTVLLVPIAGALNTCTINEVFPRLASAIADHPLLSSLVMTQLPTLAATLLNVLVPFFYDWLANQQGMISQGDVELSVISKNFFFTFFNFFVVFTTLGTASNLLDMLERFGERFSDATTIANTLAKSLARLLGFYTNLILLQGFGLFPLRLMEFGALSLYPINLIGAKTPRDYAELVQPPVFSYGFFLPQTILIFIICLVYSVLRDSWQVLLSGIAYFMIGHFVHKYQLLYAMEHRQHSTGKGWTMMCDRAILGVGLFQLTLAGQLALRKAFRRAVLIAPLFIATIWFAYVYGRTYRPLMKYIALRSLRQNSDVGRAVQEDAETNEGIATGGRQTVDEVRESGLRFEHPSLVSLRRLSLDSQSHLLLSTGGTMLDPSGDSVRDSHSPIKLERALLPSHSGSYREQACTLSGYPSTISRRTEVFRHVFPRSRHVSSASQSIASTARSRNPNTGPVPSDASPKRREVFHKAITSFFHGTHSRDGTSRLVPLVARSSASSYQSIGDPESIRGSFPSLDLVSPDAFCFSGPSLGSLSVSVDTSMSRQPCVTKNGSDSGSNYGVRSESVSAKNSLLGDAILEPSVDSSRFCNISDMLSSTDTTSEESSFYMLRTKDQNLQSVPCEENTNKFARSTAFDTRGVDGFKLGLNNTSRIVSRAPSRPPSPNFPVSHRIPHEILMLIYENLGPRDFNSARHTCHIWLEASLDRKILLKMLHRGGWADSENSEPGHQDFPGSESILTKSVPGTWSLSRRLTRECAMLSNRIPDGLIQSAPLFVNRFNVDFTELGNGAMGKFRHPAGGKSAGLLFSISVCGKYLLVARDTMIYVYKLRGSDMVALSTIMCPRRVLSMAMDASSGRNAVAALLECRMGMICELQLDDAQQVESLCDTNVESLRDQCQPRTGIPSDTREANGLQSETSKVFNSIHVSRENGSHSTVDDEDVFESIKVQSNRHALTLQATNNPQTHEQNYINHTWNMRLRGLRRGSSVGSHSPAAHMCSGTIPMETSTSTFYRHLCSEEDPPRSVSICPQRLCVAFGCSAGVELHWVDALTGQSLSRWFPLTAPSDYLNCV